MLVSYGPTEPTGQKQQQQQQAQQKPTRVFRNAIKKHIYWKKKEEKYQSSTYTRTYRREEKLSQKYYIYIYIAYKKTSLELSQQKQRSRSVLAENFWRLSEFQTNQCSQQINKSFETPNPGDMHPTELRRLVLGVVIATIGLALGAGGVLGESSSTCGPNFPAACSCGKELYESEQQYVVNCTNAGLRNTSVLEFMPEQVEVLIFTGNRIAELPWNVFGSINDYKQLRIVDMSSNHIREIRGKSYHHVPRVERLILNHNNLSISRFDDEVNHHHPRVFSNFINLQSLHLTDAFEDNSSPQLSEDLHDIFVNSQLVKLQKLHLEQNEITHFKDRNVFCDLPSLRDLHLGDNELRDVNFEVRCLNNLRFLDLERNKFGFVKPSDLRVLNELEERPNRTANLIVDFNLNPFVCDCRIAPFRTWITSTQVTVRNKDSLMCFHSPGRVDSSPAHLLQMDMAQCADAIAAAATILNTAEEEKLYGGAEASIQPQAHISGHTATLIFLLIVLSMILLGLLVALVYVSRDKLKYMITPVFDNVAKKVQYTSIKDEDCPEVHV